MFAILGDIAFEVLGSPERMDAMRRYGYAAHPVVEDFPRLQWVGDSLESIRLELVLHAAYVNPTAQLAALEAAANDHQARALVLGNGEHRGYFVITSFSIISRQLDANASAIAIQVRLLLTESALQTVVDPNAPPVPLITPIALIATSAATSSGVPSASGNGALIAGLSAVLNKQSSTGPSGMQLLPDDVSPSTIVRSPLTLH